MPTHDPQLWQIGSATAKHLVYFLFPSPFMAPVTWNNKTQSEIQIKNGISKFHVPPGYRCQLKQHMIVSALILRSNAEILHYEWNWENPTSQTGLETLIDKDIEHLQAMAFIFPLCLNYAYVKLIKYYVLYYIGFSILSGHKL